MTTTTATPITPDMIADAWFRRPLGMAVITHTVMGAPSTWRAAVIRVEGDTVTTTTDGQWFSMATRSDTVAWEIEGETPTPAPVGTVTTNGHARELRTYSDLTPETRAHFDYITLTEEDDEAYTPRFFTYRGAWFDVQDFVVIESDANPSGMRTPFGHVVSASSPLTRWHGIATDSHATATVIRWARDWDGQETYDAVVVGYWVAS
ncbi:hypothetical protein MRBLMI12_000450 [Microbacterium sp. LMI12-1-1.1]|uniref:hypothetical protein n=1 Tax=Microbacterium sp. LMI12-1-1.1 TaxID=3135225 RepID=UPI00341458C9